MGSPCETLERTGLKRFQQAIYLIAARTNVVDLRAFERAPLELIVTDLQPATLLLLSDARTVLVAVSDWCSRASAPPIGPDDDPGRVAASYLPFEREVDAAVAAMGTSYRAVEEISFIAQLELRQRQERLERARAAQGPSSLLGECDSSLRRIRKALAALDAAIAKAEDTRPLLDFTSELQASLAVRRAYARFRCNVLGDGVPTPDSLRTRFRGAGTQMAMLIGRPVYRELRVRDRLLLRELQSRVLDWLRQGETAEIAAGTRLWQDLVSCVEMLSLVSRRQELVEHDAVLIERLLKELPAAPSVEEEVPNHAWTAVSALEGLDWELDEALAERTANRGELVSMLLRLGPQARPQTSPPHTSDPSW